LSELLYLPLPSLPTNSQKSDSILIGSNRSNQLAGDDDEILGSGGKWEDEEERRFFEDVQDLKDFVPRGVLGIDEVEGKESDSESEGEKEKQRLEKEKEEVRKLEEELENLTEGGISEQSDPNEENEPFNHEEYVISIDSDPGSFRIQSAHSYTRDTKSNDTPPVSSVGPTRAFAASHCSSRPTSGRHQPSPH
jgi:hypothetical protein